MPVLHPLRLRNMQARTMPSDPSLFNKIFLKSVDMQASSYESPLMQTDKQTVNVIRFFGLELPENPTAVNCHRQAEMVNMAHVWQGHDNDCCCNACDWANNQIQINGTQPS